MTMDVITLEHVTKQFQLRGKSHSLKSRAIELLRGRVAAAPVLKALDDVSFTVRQGETLGIIGANGAGKSTLLSVITGTLFPSGGTVRTRGTISALLELGAGFHPDLSGRENVYLYGAIMGLTRRQMQQRFDAIVEFSGLKDFIDQPVKHYSSGMYVRLGFAVAVEVDPDILLIDEVLAVGDVNFQRKCIQKMEEFRKCGKTMLIISHDLHAIQSISDRIVFLDHGRIMGIGTPAEMIGQYQDSARQQASGHLRREWGTGEVRIESAEFRTVDGRESRVFNHGEPLEVTIRYQASQRIANPVFGFAIADASGRVVFGNNTQLEQFTVPVIEGCGSVTARLENLPLGAGPFLFSFSVHSADHQVNYHRLDHAFPVTVKHSKATDGCCYIPTQWKVDG
jgi:ABC-2 type transport system ATP-binding protein